MTQPKITGKIVNDNAKVWEWRIQEEVDNVEMTVALPALNANKIIWLALESLKNQKNVNFKWELICIEDHGHSRKIFAGYKGKLPNCVRMKHVSVDPIKESRYKEGNLKHKYLLLDKWSNIAKMASAKSKIFVMHAIDDYSAPKRLYIHYEHFKNPDCYFSTQLKGVFYNIKTRLKMFYNGSKIDPPITNSLSKASYFSKNHLNMALRLHDMKRIAPAQKNSGIDGHIFKAIADLNKINFSEKKHNFLDSEIDNNNWKYALFTDGYNNISHGRKNVYEEIKKPTVKPGLKVWDPFNKKFMQKYGYKGMCKYIPFYVVKRLLEMK